MKTILSIVALFTIMATAPVLAFDISVGAVSGLSTITIDLLDASTVAFEGDEEELRVVRDDARDYLAGEDLTDRLASIMSAIELQATEEGATELINNRERIAFEILNN